MAARSGLMLSVEYRKNMAAVQRRETLLIASFYRTVVKTIALVRVISIDLLAKERRHIYVGQMQGGTTTIRGIRQHTMQFW